MLGSLEDFRVLPISLAWEAYLKACEAQKVDKPPVQPPAGAAAFTDRQDFAAGVCLYPTQYHTVIAEFLVTNPNIPMWERHAGVVRLAHAVRDYAAVGQMDLWFAVRHAGLKRALERAGFRSRGAEVYGP